MPSTREGGTWGMATWGQATLRMLAAQRPAQPHRLSQGHLHHWAALTVVGHEAIVRAHPVVLQAKVRAAHMNDMMDRQCVVWFWRVASASTASHHQAAKHPQSNFRLKHMMVPKLTPHKTTSMMDPAMCWWQHAGSMQKRLCSPVDASVCGLAQPQWCHDRHGGALCTCSATIHPPSLWPL